MTVVELTVHELFAVVWNVIKIVLGVIFYEYVFQFASHLSILALSKGCFLLILYLES